MDIEVVRADLGRARTVDTPTPDVSDGEAVFRIDSFALTANNVTYGAVGDLVGYWNFYPASAEGWGRIPVWGFADVAASRADGVEVGERYFGFWPMSTEAVLRPGSAGPTGFTDVTPHRVALPAIYNRYARTPGDADAHAEALTSLLRPLFATSFLIDAWLADEDVFGADSVVISSASSKTALGLAYLLKTNGRATVVGLTSPANVGFVEDTDAYDRIVPYAELPAGLGDGTAVYVDFAGSADVLSAVHHHFGDRLRRSVTVGFTHRAAGDNAALPAPKPEFFFAPDHIVRRTEQWGGRGMAERIDAARVGFDRAAGATIEVVERIGADEIIDCWTAAVDGGLDPRQGVICRW
jgi:hypothetical protein